MTFTFEDTPSIAATEFVARVPAGLATSGALLEALYEQLELPSYFGFNWNALSDCLRDLSWMRQACVVLCHADLPPLPEAELRVYLSVLAEAVDSWGPGEPHSLRVVFPQAVRRALEAVADT